MSAVVLPGVLHGGLPGRHLPGTDGARDVPTMPFQLGSRLVPEVVAASEVGLLAGPPGTGKTFTILAACETLQVPVVYVVPPVSPKVRAVQTGLLDALGVPYAANAPAAELDRLLVATLAEMPRVIVYDEAARLGRDGLEELRYLHCQPSAAWSLFLVGSDLERMLGRNPALDSRVARRVLFRPLPKDRSLSFAARYHERFAEAPRALLERIERQARGNLRVWARTLEKCLALLAESGGTHLTPAIVAAALAATRGIEA